MKKYLMTGVAALAICAAFTSCSSKEELYNPDQINQNEAAQIVEKYNQAFLKYVGGTIAPDQTWGFGGYSTAATRANTGETYNATSEGINANANEWADVKNSTGYGGWLVPDPLTQAQKDLVIAYFQSHPNIQYQDPQWRHFFVQQVYKGGDAQSGSSSENITAADGTSVYNSSNMNLLTVGANHQHINNFNGGTYGVNGIGGASSVSVLDNGSDILAGETSYHNDQIMLMVNIDDTSCMGYHETGSSTHHDNKAAIVGWETIRTWARAQGIYTEDILNDGWNRSFVGFDLALKEGAAAYAEDESGNVIYATYAQAPEAPAYAWDGEKVIPIKEISYINHDNWTETVIGDYLDAYKTIQNIGYLTTNENFYVAADKVTLDQTYGGNGVEIQASSLTTVQNAVVIKDLVYDGTKYQAVINLPKINQLVADGYLPVMDNSLTEWVQVGKSDGYFTDWIVTLNEAQRVPEPTPDPDNVCIIAEDLSASEATDFDFNDVVFTVEYTSTTSAKVTLYAAGGTLPLTVAGTEVHAAFGYGQPDEKGLYKMINTGAKADVNGLSPVVLFENLSVDKSKRGNDITILVDKGTKNAEGVHVPNWIELTAKQGTPAAKLCVGTEFATGTKWCAERESIKKKYSAFAQWVATNPAQIWWY